MHKDNKKFIIHYVISIIIYIIFLLIPPAAPITELGMNLMGIVVMMIYGLIFIGPVVPSLTAIILASFTGYFGPGIQASIMAIGSNFVATLVLTLMMFSGVLTASGLARGMAEKIVYSKLANGRPWVLTLLIMLAALVPSMFLTALPVVFIMFSIVNEIAELVGFKKGDKWPMVMNIMVTFCALIGMTMMPFNVGVAGDFAILLSLDPTQVVPTGMFIISSLTLAAVMVAITFIIIRFVIKPDVTLLKNYTSRHEVRFTTDQKRGIVMLIILIVLVILPDCLPAGSAAKAFFSNFGSGGAAVLVVLIACIIRNKDGTEFLTFEKIAHEGVFWPMLLMIGALNIICGSLSSDQVGIVAALQQVLEPIVGGMSPFAFFVFFVIVCYVLTNILDGAVVAYIAIPIMYVVSPMVGLTATGMMAVMTHNVQSGLALPSASPSAAIMFGLAKDDYWYNRKQATKYGCVCALIYLVSMIIVYFPFVKMM